MRILGIETSADDTGIALIEAEGEFGKRFQFNVLGNAVSSQAIHAQYGGIFPAMAKREHGRNMVPTFTEVLRQAGELKHTETGSTEVVEALLDREPELREQLIPFLQTHEKPNIDALAVTHGPGLEPGLWVGINFARALSAAWDIPIVPVNHMEGHLMMSLMEVGLQLTVDSQRNKKTVNGKLSTVNFPCIVLLVSGGHTELILMRGLGQYEYLGRTRDDAAGEAFDKIARLMDLPYPGGPEISRLAEEARSRKLDPLVKLPRPMITSNDYDFSFSGLKTAVERFVTNREWQSLDRERIAREVEDAITDVLIYKTLRAVEEHSVSSVIMSGGVSANKHIRAAFQRQLSAVDCKLLVCPPEFSTDNGLMIALSGYFHALKKEFIPLEGITAVGNLKLEENTGRHDELSK